MRGCSSLKKEQQAARVCIFSQIMMLVLGHVLGRYYLPKASASFLIAIAMCEGWFFVSRHVLQRDWLERELNFRVYGS